MMRLDLEIWYKTAAGEEKMFHIQASSVDEAVNELYDSLEDKNIEILQVDLM